jgi:hypothetical protein
MWPCDDDDDDDHYYYYHYWKEEEEDCNIVEEWSNIQDLWLL